MMKVNKYFDLFFITSMAHPLNDLSHQKVSTNLTFLLQIKYLLENTFYKMITKFKWTIMEYKHRLQALNKP